MLYPTPQNVSIHYHTLEAYPIAIAQAGKLNYPEVLGLSDENRQHFLHMHECPSSKEIQFNERFSFTKHIVKLEDFETTKRFDVIYYDAFAPNAQEHLWTEDIMHKLAGFSNQGCALVTYCAKGSVKRALRAANFLVEGLPGPIGKREMTRAVYSSL